MWRVKLKAISEASGYSSIAFTTDVYSHIIEGMLSEMIVLLNNLSGLNHC
jgi:hypothetical protein